MDELQVRFVPPQRLPLVGLERFRECTVYALENFLWLLSQPNVEAEPLKPKITRLKNFMAYFGIEIVEPEWFGDLIEKTTRQ